MVRLTEAQADDLSAWAHYPGEEFEMTHWSELNVFDAESALWGTLEEMVNTSPVDLSGAVIREGRIVEWPSFFIAAPGEAPDWDTPRGEVDWTGFTQSLAAVEGHI